MTESSEQVDNNERTGDAYARHEVLELAITAAGIGTFDWDLVNGTLLWDDALIALFGYSNDDFDQTIEAFSDRLHPEDHHRVNSELQSAMGSCGEFKSEYRIVLPSGDIRWVGASGRVLCNENGFAVRMLGAAWDNTAKAMGDARLARVIESMSTAFFALDTSWRFTYVNPEAETVLGRTRAELIGQNVWELFPAAVGSDFEKNYRHAMTTGEPVAFDAYYPAPLDKWFEVRARRNADGLAVYFIDITARHSAQLAAEKASERADLLSRITEQLSGTLDSEEAAVRLSRLIVPTLAEWCIVTLIDDSAAPGSRKGLGKAIGFHSNPDMQALTEQYAALRLEALTDDSIVSQAMEEAQPHVIATGAADTVLPMLEAGPARDLLAQLEPDSVAVLPLTGREGSVGMLTVVNRAERGAFSKHDLDTIRHVAARSGLVMDNARLYRQQLEVAEGLQRSLFTAPPQPDHVQIVVRYTPAAEAAQVGGDWYDAFLQPGGATVIVIGDVIGHDTEAAAAMSQVRTLLRGIGALDNDSPAQILHKLDRVLQTLLLETSATVVVARLEQTESERDRGVTRVRWSNAGHPPPMILNPDGTVLPLASVAPDVFLGVLADVERTEYEVTLDRDATLLMYTDGLVERRGQSLEDGLAKLLAELEGLSETDLDEVCDSLLARMLPPEPEDDVALVAVRLHRQDVVRPAEAGPNYIPSNVAGSPAVVKQPK